MGPISKIHGYDVTILIDLCKAILAAEFDGALPWWHGPSIMGRVSFLSMMPERSSRVTRLDFKLSHYLTDTWVDVRARFWQTATGHGTSDS